MKFRICKNKFDVLAKSKIFPPLVEEMKGRGVNNLAKTLDYSPSPQASPVKGEGLFWTFGDSIKFGGR